MPVIADIEQEDLLTELRSCREVIQAAVNEIKSFQFEPSSWSEEDAAEMLGIKVTTLQRYRRNGRIGFAHIAGRARYTRSHINKFLESNSEEPISKRKGFGKPQTSQNL